MKINAHACRHLVLELNALVDGQLPPLEVTRLVSHTQSCEGCGDYIDNLRQLSELHRRKSELLEGLESDPGEQVLPTPDAGAFLGRLLGRAAEDEWTTLARLFYELGKAYVLAGNKRLPGSERREVNVKVAPSDIRRTEARARQRLAQVDDLNQHGAQHRRGDLFRGRSRKLFASSSSGGASALVKGRRFLEEALAITPELHEARIYLGFQLLVSGRADRARAEFRRVHRDSTDASVRLMAMQWLGNLAVNTSRLDEAVSCYAQVVAADGASNEPKLMASFLNLPVTLAKLGRWDEAIDHFTRLVQQFPERLGQAREMLASMAAFRSLLDQNQPIRRTLLDRVPGLFAAA